MGNCASTTNNDDESLQEEAPVKSREVGGKPNKDGSYQKSDLEAMKISELKKLAKDKNIKYKEEDVVEKKDLVDLIIDSKKVKIDKGNKKKKDNTKEAATPKKETNNRASKVDKDGFAEGATKTGKYKFSENKFSGAVVCECVGKEQEFSGKSIAKGIETFKKNPEKYCAMTYQVSMLEWPVDQQVYKYIHREGTKGYKPQGIDNKNGWMAILMNEFEALPSFKDNILPTQYRDKYTDNMSYQKIKLHSKKNPPLLPGRGMGCCDNPMIKIIGDVDPSDIAQGTVGDCWLLSGISSLAEFDGAIKRLFRKTKKLEQRPFDKPNMYTVTLWDLETWKEVDIEIDERLPAQACGNGQLLASHPSEDGELWVCYLEKAIACHAGGWDKITGGQCTHAWALMTGCKEQYTIRINPETGKFACYAKYNPNEKKWIRHANSPHDGEKTVYRVEWPRVGGGGGVDVELTKDELFLKMVAWDQQNYIVAAAVSKSTGKKKKADAGLVENHAYSVIEAHHNVANSKIDLLKVRNPWGTGEIEDGMFDDDGPGWKKYPKVKKAINPVAADDGIFYVTKDEFFKMYDTVYLSASDMTEFLED